MNPYKVVATSLCLILFAATSPALLSMQAVYASPMQQPQTQSPAPATTPVDSAKSGSVAVAETPSSGSISEFRDQIFRSISSKPATYSRGIGTVETVNTMTIDGRVAHGRTILWGGEMLVVPADTSARVSLDSVAQIVLTGGTEARLTISNSGAEGQILPPMLEATLSSGAMLVKLDKGGALIHAGGSTFAAFTGAQFRFGLRDGQVVIDPIGEDAVEQPARGVSNWMIRPVVSVIESAGQAAQPQAQSTTRRYVIRPLDLTTNLSVRARTTREIQYRVTDENDRPVPDLPVIIGLGGKGGKSLGTLSAAQTKGSSVRVFTDQQGVAKATFNADAETGSVSINATIEGTSITTTGTIGITSASAFLTSATLIPVIATAAAGVTAAVVSGANKDESREFPLRLSGPQVVKQ